MEKQNNGDLISRKELEKALATLGRMYIDGIADDKAYLSEQRIYEVLRNAPAVEAEPVIHCEKCAHYNADTLSCRVWGECGESWHGDDYCSYGAHMDEEVAK